MRLVPGRGVDVGLLDAGAISKGDPALSAEAAQQALDPARAGDQVCSCR